MIRSQRIPLKAVIGICALTASHTGLADKAKLGESVKQQLKTIEILVDGQKKVVEIDDRTQELLAEYRLTMRKIDNTKRYNAQLTQLIVDQKVEKESIAKQIDELKVTNQEIVPLMNSMVTALEELVQSDTPFLREERTQRVEELKKMMTRADVTNSEKYRRILEAYMIEADYGKTLEAYRGLLSKDGQELTVDYLRIGRITFAYQTLDGKRQAVWNPSKNQWSDLTSEYRSPISEALKIARKQTAPSLVQIPVFKSGRSM